MLITVVFITGENWKQPKGTRKENGKDMRNTMKTDSVM